MTTYIINRYNHDKMRILQLCEFSSGICGVWQRVKQEAAEFIKRGHEVHVFSSNLAKGTDELVKAYEEKQGIKIHRFPVKFRFGENALSWDFGEKALKLRPDIIITHLYRHPHSHKAIKIAKKIRAKCFLVTHAPFVDKRLRSWRLNLLVLLYDSLFGKVILNSYTKVIAITKWEIPYLLKLGCRKKNVVYLPNGLPEEFFKTKIKKGKRIFFIGRIAPIKNLELLVNTASNLRMKLTIIGPLQKGYILETKNADLKPPIHNLKKKICEIDKYEIFVLPSYSEAFGQSLLEAMARGKMCISSNTQGGKEIIENNKNGFLFETGNKEQLRRIIMNIQNMPEKEKAKVRRNARRTAEMFNWPPLIKKWERLFEKVANTKT